MVNPTKYDDFLEHDRVVKQYHGVDVEFVQYKCPLEGCDDVVNVRADDVDKRKSTRCLAHLKMAVPGGFSFIAASGWRFRSTWPSAPNGGTMTKLSFVPSTSIVFI